MHQQLQGSHTGEQVQDGLACYEAYDIYSTKYSLIPNLGSTLVRCILLSLPINSEVVWAFSKDSAWHAEDERMDIIQRQLKQIFGILVALRIQPMLIIQHCLVLVCAPFIKGYRCGTPYVFRPMPSNFYANACISLSITITVTITLTSLGHGFSCAWCRGSLRRIWHFLWQWPQIMRTSAVNLLLGWSLPL